MYITYTLKIYEFFLKNIPHIAYTLKIYDIIVQHKEKFV